MAKKVEYGSDRVKTNPADWYWREDVMKVEREQVFMKHWQLFARSAQFENTGDYVAETVAGIPVIVVMDQAGELKAFHNVCRHRAGAVLAEGGGNCSKLRCIYHGWTYDLDGALIRAPKIMQEPDFNADKFSLMPVKCQVWNGMVFVNFDLHSESLEEWLGDIVDIMASYPSIENDLVFVREGVEDFPANWKAFGDNSCEGYHLPLIHKEMASEIQNHVTEIHPYEGGYVGFNVTYKDNSKGCWIYKYPNFMFSCEDGYINVQSTDPVSPTSSRLRDYFWFDKNISKEDIAEELKYADLVTQQDKDICQAVQKNLQAGIYQYGELSATAEKGTRYFQALVRKDLEGKISLAKEIK